MTRASSELESRFSDVVKRKLDTQHIRMVLKRTWRMKNLVDLIRVGTSAVLSAFDVKSKVSTDFRI